MKEKSLRVIELIDYRAGICRLASDFLSLEEGLLNDTRRELVRCYRHGEKYLVCGLCHGPLCLKGGSDKSHKQRLHFFHLPSPESNECPLHLGSQISKDEMRAIIYDGVKESPCHREMKNTLGSILALDSSCHDIYVDELFKRRLPHERYKPDVQGYCLDKNIIFEIQISSDFVTVIQSREEYYRNKNAYLLWIFNAFSTDFAQQTLAQKDIFYGNNRHAFCFTRECATLSYQHKALHLQVFYQMPLIANGRIEFRSVPPQIITLHDIQFDSDFTAYFYDFKRKYEECQQELAAIAERQKQAIAKEAHKALLLELKYNMQNLPYFELERYIREKCGLNFEATDASSLIKYIFSALKEKPTLIGGDNNKSLYRNTRVQLQSATPAV